MNPSRPDGGTGGWEESWVSDGRHGLFGVRPINRHRIHCGLTIQRLFPSRLGIDFVSQLFGLEIRSVVNSDGRILAVTGLRQLLRGLDGALDAILGETARTQLRQITERQIGVRQQQALTVVGVRILPQD